MCLTVADTDSDAIALNGTIKLCEDLGVDPQDVSLLALAYELKSTEMCVWGKQGWMDGWQTLGWVLHLFCQCNGRNQPHLVATPWNR